MRSDKSFIIYILILLVIPPVFYYLVVGQIPVRYDSSPGICFVGILLGFVIVYVVFRAQEKYFSKNIDFEDIGKDPSSETHPVGSRSRKKKKNVFLDRFRSKNKCGYCGTEMEYKEAMDCHYCPECREYK